MEEFGFPVWGAFLAFARMGSLCMLLPGLGEAYVSPRFRLTIAVLFALVLAPTAAAASPHVPANGFAAIGIIVGEMVVGLAIGAAARMVMSALATAGQIAALQTGLAMATTFDPSVGGQSAQLQAFLAMLGLTLAMTANLHHGLIEAAWASYQRFPPGAPLPIGDWSEYALNSMGSAFAIAVQMSAPLLVFGFLYYAALGMVSRMLPQIQIFFAAMPAGVGLGLLVFMLTLGVSMSIFLNSLEQFTIDWR
jgi:flagellar biosynthetic protein FliR